MKEKCPFCEKEFIDVLRHISIHHNITDMHKVAQQKEITDEEDMKRSAFAQYVRELNEKLAKKEITGQKYRELTKKWHDEKKWRDTNG